MYIEATCAVCGKVFSRFLQKRVERHFCSMECKAEWQRQQRPVTVEWLQQKYVEEGLDTSQIGALVNRDPKSVWNWLKGSGIPTRGRGTASAHKFVKGQPNGWKGHTHSAESREKMRAIAKAEGRVPFDPAVGSYMVGRRGSDTPSWKGGITPERQAFYTTAEWKAACVEVWHRADARCERCGVDHRTVDRKVQRFHIHHIVSFMVRELRAEPTNLALLCDRCYRFVHGKKNVNREFLGEEANGSR